MGGLGANSSPLPFSSAYDASISSPCYPQRSLRIGSLKALLRRPAGPAAPWALAGPPVCRPRPRGGGQISKGILHNSCRPVNSSPSGPLILHLPYKLDFFSLDIVHPDSPKSRTANMLSNKCAKLG